MHICLFGLILLECKFRFDLGNGAIEPLFVLFQPSFVSLIELTEMFLEVFELVTHGLLVSQQMLQSLRKSDFNLHSDMAFQEVVVDLGLQELYSLSNGSVTYNVLHRFLHTVQVPVHFVLGGFQT